MIIIIIIIIIIIVIIIPHSSKKQHLHERDSRTEMAWSVHNYH